jgi:hypothetical protein
MLLFGNSRRRSFFCWSVGTLLSACVGPVAPQQTIWEADLVATGEFVGLTGSAAAVAEEARRRTEASIRIDGGPPSSVLPWRIRAGPCLVGGDVHGSPVSYPDLTTNELGSGSVDTVLPQALRAGRTYSVEVWRGPADEQPIACGALNQR